MSLSNNTNSTANSDQQKWVKPELQVLSINATTLGDAVDTVDTTPGLVPAS